jgi:hypothetical protein
MCALRSGALRRTTGVSPLTFSSYRAAVPPLTHPPMPPQIVAMFVSLNFAWPPELESLYAAMSVFNFNIQITAPEVTDMLVGLGCADGFWGLHAELLPCASDITAA